MRVDAKLGSHFFDGLAAVHHSLESVELIGGMKRVVQHILGRAQRLRIVRRVDKAGDGIVLRNLPQFDAIKLRETPTLAGGDEKEARGNAFIDFRFHDRIVHLPVRVDRRGERANVRGRMRNLPRVLQGLLQSIERNENAFALGLRSKLDVFFTNSHNMNSFV
ncbi:MAG: hypothetical protein WDO56_15785 [Gammaproteobacteria bacterium]